MSIKVHVERFDWQQMGLREVTGSWKLWPHSWILCMWGSIEGNRSLGAWCEDSFIPIPPCLSALPSHHEVSSSSPPQTTPMMLCLTTSPRQWHHWPWGTWNHKAEEIRMPVRWFFKGMCHSNNNPPQILSLKMAYIVTQAKPLFSNNWIPL